MSRASDAVSAMLKEVMARQADIAQSVHTAERTLIKRRKVLAEIDAEVRELEADLTALQRVKLSVVA